MPDPRKKYGWDASTMRWRDQETGRYVSDAQAARAVRAVDMAGERRLRSHANALARGTFTAATWRDQMIAEVKYQHTAATAAAWGGWKQVPQDAWLRAGRGLRQEVRYIDRLARLVDQGALDPNSRGFKARAESYAGQARMRFAGERARALAAAGVQAIAIWHLGPADHCPGCTSEASRTKKGVPAGEVHAIGSHECKWFCKCHIEYKAVRAKRDGRVAPGAKLVDGKLVLAPLEKRMLERAESITPAEFKALTAHEKQALTQLTKHGLLTRTDDPLTGIKFTRKDAEPKPDPKPSEFHFTDDELWSLKYTRAELEQHHPDDPAMRIEVLHWHDQATRKADAALKTITDEAGAKLSLTQERAEALTSDRAVRALITRGDVDVWREAPPYMVNIRNDKFLVKPDPQPDPGPVIDQVTLRPPPDNLKGLMREMYDRAIYITPDEFNALTAHQKQALTKLEKMGAIVRKVRMGDRVTFRLATTEDPIPGDGKTEKKKPGEVKLIDRIRAFMGANTDELWVKQLHEVHEATVRRATAQGHGATYTWPVPPVATGNEDAYFEQTVKPYFEAAGYTVTRTGKTALGDFTIQVHRIGRKDPAQFNKKTAAEARAELANLAVKIDAERARIQAEIEAIQQEEHKLALAGAGYSDPRREEMRQRRSKLYTERSQAPGRLAFAAVKVENPADLTLKVIGGNTQQGWKPKVQEGFEAFTKLVGTGTLDGKTAQVKYKQGRAFYDLHGTAVVSNGGNVMSTTAHELGHWLEDVDPDVHRKVLRFLKRRVAGHPLKTMKEWEGYKDKKEIAWKDNFSTAYVGKLYSRKGERDPFAADAYRHPSDPQMPDSVWAQVQEERQLADLYATEVLSMGVQFMVEDAAAFARRDPDFFDFIYEVLRGR